MLQLDFPLFVALLILLCRTNTAVRVIGWSSTVTAGENAIMFCQLVETSEKLTRITWQKKTRQTLINKDFFVVTSDGKTEKKNGLGDRTEFIGNIPEVSGTILLKNVTLLDEGFYTCIFNIFPSGPFEAQNQLSVQVRPVVSVTTEVIPVVGDSEVTLATCIAAKARPAADVSWRLGALSDSVKVKNTNSDATDGTFTVKSVLIGLPSRDLNQQKVQCLVNHTTLSKELELDYSLDIHYPPQVVHIKSVPTASQEFHCVADANPQPKFTWSRVNKTLSSHVDANRLIISPISDNTGLYMCNVSNQYGSATGKMYVHVSTPSSPACWSLVTILTILFIASIIVCCIWKFNLSERIPFISTLRERFRGIAVPTSSPRNERRSHQDGNLSEEG